NHGANVALCLAEPDRLTDVPKLQRKIFQSTAGREVATGELPASADLVIDAVVGYTLQGAPRGNVASLIGWANRCPARVLALDVPSGIDSTSGEAPGESIDADWTMTLALPKLGLLSERAGEVVLADIGIPRAVYDRLGIAYENPFDGNYLVPLVRRP